MLAGGLIALRAGSRVRRAVARRVRARPRRRLERRQHGGRRARQLGATATASDSRRRASSRRRSSSPTWPCRSRPAARATASARDGRGSSALASWSSLQRRRARRAGAGARDSWRARSWASARGLAFIAGSAYVRAQGGSPFAQGLFGGVGARRRRPRARRSCRRSRTGSAGARRSSTALAVALGGASLRCRRPDAIGRVSRVVRGRRTAVLSRRPPLPARRRLYAALARAQRRRRQLGRDAARPAGRHQPGRGRRRSAR